MKHFTINELTASSKAVECRIDNTPPSCVKIKLLSLVENLLDPVREKWGRPLIVNSGYRCPRLNQEVGGAPTSQHIRGEAADITAGGSAENNQLFKMILDSGLDFDQLIDESGYRWIHISYSAGKNRRQILHLK